MATQPENQLALVRQLREQNQQLAAENHDLKHGGGGGTSGGVTEDWKDSVDRQLTQLHGDVRALLYGLIALAVLLAGGGFTLYSQLGNQVSEVRVQQAKQDAKLDLLVERTAPEASGATKP